MKRLVLALALTFATSAAFGPALAQKPIPEPKAEDAKPGPTDPLVIVAGGKETKFQVELAATEAQSERGLMFRPSMPKDHGMIFDFGTPKTTGMYMKNTLIPLDMLFIDTDGTVLAVAVNARPHSLRTISPGFPIKAVLELNGGVAKELGIKPGDKVEHKIFKNLK